MVTHPVFVQFNSSEKSLQSLSLSHSHVLGMQRPLAHSYWSAVQLACGPEKIEEKTWLGTYYNSARLDDDDFIARTAMRFVWKITAIIVAIAEPLPGDAFSGQRTTHFSFRFFALYVMINHFPTLKFVFFSCTIHLSIASKAIRIV